MSRLPTPVTVTDELLLALHKEVVGLRADLAMARGGEPTAPEQTGRVDVREPSMQTSRRPRAASTSSGVKGT